MDLKLIGNYPRVTCISSAGDVNGSSYNRKKNLPIEELAFKVGKTNWWLTIGGCCSHSLSSGHHFLSKKNSKTRGMADQEKRARGSSHSFCWILLLISVYRTPIPTSSLNGARREPPLRQLSFAVSPAEKDSPSSLSFPLFLFFLTPIHHKWKGARKSKRIPVTTKALFSIFSDNGKLRNKGGSYKTIMFHGRKSFWSGLAGAGKSSSLLTKI